MIETLKYIVQIGDNIKTENPAFYPGGVASIVNEFRKEMGLPLRLNYAGKVKNSISFSSIHQCHGPQLINYLKLK